MANMSLKKNPMPSQDPNVRNKNFDEVALGYTEEQALDEAQRCLHCKNKPCMQGCPVMVHIPDFIAEVAKGDFEAAYQIIAATSALPAVCGRVCPQESQCEKYCVRGIKGEPVGIGRLERFVADWHREHASGAAEKPASNGHRVAVVGSGPSGLTCAGDLARKGYDVTVFEALHLAGGVLVYGIPEFRLPKTIVQKEVDGLKELGVTIATDTVIGRTITVDELMEEQGFEAVFIGSGAGLPMFMNIPGVNYKGVLSANEFLTRINLMKAYKPDSDTPIQHPKKVAVVGGGNVAIDVARNACRLGSEHVEMFCLESEAQMPASEEERREAVEDGAHISCGWGPKEIHLDEAGRVCGITFKRCTRVFDDEGRFAPEYDENDLRRVDADRVVMSIGQSIVWGDLLAGSKVELGRGQGALADPQTYQTAEPDIFVGGDVYTGPSFAIDAIAAGHEAAVSIHRFVQPGSTLTIGRNQRRYAALDRDDVVIESYDNASREVAHVDHEREKAAPFSEYVETFTEEQVRAETARCLGCGASIVDPNKCIGCGLCTTKCAFDAIHLDRDRPECSTMVKYEQKLPSLGKYALKRAIKIKFGRK